jgi:hypothetical protein
MKSVCLCGSFRFYEEMVQLRNALQARGALCEWPLPGPRHAPQAMTADEARDAITQHLERIDGAECIFKFNKDSHFGNSVRNGAEHWDRVSTAKSIWRIAPPFFAGQKIAQFGISRRITWLY